MKTMTVKEAIDAGYTHYISDGDDVISEIADIDLDDEDELAELRNGTKWIVNYESPEMFTISPEDIKDLILSKIENDDERPEGQIDDIYKIAENHNYQSMEIPLSELNAKFVKYPMYKALDIELVF